MPICIEIGSVIFEVQRSHVGNRRTNEQTDRRTDGRTGREHYASDQCITAMAYGYVRYNNITIYKAHNVRKKLNLRRQKLNLRRYRY